MAVTCMISTEFWEQSEDLTSDEKLVLIFFKTCPQRNICGLFQIGLNAIAVNTALSVEKVEQAIVGLSQRKKVVYTKPLLFLKGYAEEQGATKLGYFRNHLAKVYRAYGLEHGDTAAFLAFLSSFEEPLRQMLTEGIIKPLPQGFQQGLLDYSLEQPLLEGLSKGLNTNTIANTNTSVKERGVRGERKKKDFTPPTYEEVLGYMSEFKDRQSNPARDPKRLAERFVTHYSNDDWHYGKGTARKKMTNWKQAASRWCLDSIDNSTMGGHSKATTEEERVNGWQ